MIIYLTKPGTTLNKKGGKLIIRDPEEKQEKIVPWGLIDSIVVFSKVQLTSDVINTCLREKIPVFFVTGNGRYLGKLDSLEYRNVEVLYKQISCAMSEECSLKYAKIFIKSKIHNSKVMLQRRRKKSDRVVEIDDVLESLNYYLKQIEEVDNLDSLRGLEGGAAKIYYEGFGRFLRPPFMRTGRSKRPPLDPVNALLSLGYTLLAQTIHMYLEIIGLDPQIGFMHQPKDLRSLLVLDTMEMFRAWIVDDLVLKVIWKNIIQWEDFVIERHSVTPVLLTEDGLRKFISEYHKAVFKKVNDDSLMVGDDWVKLKLIEKTLEEFKKSIIEPDFEYKGFMLK